MSDIQQLIDTRLHAKRGLLLLLGTLTLAAGILALLAPFALLASIPTIVGGVLIGSGLIKAGQLLLGVRRRGYEGRGVSFILIHVLIDVGLGLLLLNFYRVVAGTLQILVAIVVVLDGVVQLFIGLRAPKLRSRIIFITLGLVSVGLGVAVPFTPLSLERTVGLFMGIRLVLFGAGILAIGFQSPREEDPIYRGERPDEVERIPGELYAGYFGAAFHLGVYVGNDEVVHFTDRNLVSKVSWEAFCRGRATQRWDYPDVADVSTEEVIATALSHVGEESKYDLFTNNCEHFAIYCKSGGRTRHSAYAQIDAGVSNLTSRPILGPILEIYARGVEKLAFDMGGMFGRRVALGLRKLTSTFTIWLVSRRMTRPAAGS